MPSGLEHSLSRAVNRGDLRTVKNLFNLFGFDWQKLSGGYSLVLAATEKGFMEIAKFFVEKGANVNDFISDNYPAPLHFAVQNNSLEFVEILLEKGALIDARNSLLQTPLLIAAEKGYIEIAKLLVKNGAQINDSNYPYEHTPLHFAVQNNNLELVEILLEKDALIDAKNKLCQTPLLIAAEKGFVEIAEFLVKNGAQVNDADNNGRDTPLHYAVQNNSLELVKILLEKDALIDARNKERRTPLHIAAEKGNKDCMLLLLNEGAYVDPVARFGETPLRIAVKKQSLSLVEHILKFGPNVNKKIYETILKTALSCKSKEIVSLLTRYGFTLSQDDVHNSSLFHSAIEKAQKQLIEFLLNYGADPNCFFEGNTPLHSAVRSGCLETVSLLINAQCDVNAVDRFGKTPLYYSVDYSKSDKGLEMLKLLLASGAKVNSKNLLHNAVKNECFEVCEILVKNGANPNYAKNGDLPLHTAVKSGQKKIVELLLNAKANVNTLDISGKAPLDYSVEYAEKIIGAEIFKLLLANGATFNKELLHNVVKNENYEICEVLINNGSDVNALDEETRTPLHYTAYLHTSYCNKRQVTNENRIKIAELLLNSGADVNAKCKYGVTVLHFASQFGYEKLVEFLLKNDASVNSCDNLGNTALAFAVCRGHTQILKTLILYGADVNFINPHTDYTPLLIAASTRPEVAETVKILLEQGADVNQVTEFDETALHLAAERAHAEIMDILLKNGAQVDALNGEGLTALHVVGREVIDAPYDAIKVLLKYTADVNYPSPSGETPLHILLKRCGRMGDKKIVKLLLKSGANVNVTDSRGITPLHIAAVNECSMEERVKLVKILLKFKADINKKNNIGETALHMASRRGYRYVVEVLLENGADINLLNNSGQTALDLAHDEMNEYNLIDLSSSFDSVDGCAELTAETLQYHTIQLKIAGFFVCQNNLKWIENDEDDSLDDYKYFCEKEVAMMKSHELCCHLSLYNFLVGNANFRCFKDENLDQALDSVDFDKYAIYGKPLVRNIKAVKLRWELFTGGFDWFITLTKTGNILSETKIPALPPELVENVLEFLDNGSLKNLISCGKQLEEQVRKTAIPNIT